LECWDKFNWHLSPTARCHAGVSIGASAPPQQIRYEFDFSLTLFNAQLELDKYGSNDAIWNNCGQAQAVQSKLEIRRHIEEHGIAGTLNDIATIHCKKDEYDQALKLYNPQMICVGLGELL
jgi:hypothetical protein